MADPMIGATVEVLLEKILALATDNIGLLFGLKQDVEILRRSVAMIRAILADAEKKQQQQEAVKLWLKCIEEVAYEADDVLDHLDYELLRCRVKTTGNTLQCNSQSVACGSNTAIHAIVTGVTISRETDSVVDQSVVGRVNDASNIVQKLLSPSAETISFIPITGMGGLGKTTLAKFVYNEARIDKYFDKKIWVCVSDNFDVTRVFKLILESLGRKTIDMVGRDSVVQEIKKQLEGKRYLLVLDDVWCESSTTWDDFLRSLAGISTVKGNWSLVTTRLRQVASIVTAEPAARISLKKLPDEDCWTILKEKAFPSAERLEELKAIKKETVGACQGLPLAANVVGGLLRINPKEEWLSIVRNEIPNMTGDVMQILRLSFDHLPSGSIKKCFAYCSLFEKHSVLVKDKLIQLWMAEGFLGSDQGNVMEMEAVGSRYYDILVKSCLIEEVTDEVFGITNGRMHDLVHDLALIVSGSETIYVEQGARIDNCPARRIVLESLQLNMHTMLRKGSSFVRTMFVRCDISDNLSLLHFKCLHVLNLSRSSKYKQLPNSVSKLIHLRYLDLSYTLIEALPESLCQLYKLQTLRLVECFRLRKLPEQMSNLISLRHFHFKPYHSGVIQMPLRMGKLTCLQTLEFFHIGEEEGRRIEEIGWLRNLGGRLIIRNLEKVTKGKEGALLANLSGKSKLVNLTLQWGEVSSRGDNNDDENVLEGLQPYLNLQQLVVRNFMGCRFPSWIETLHNLVDLRLINCGRCEEIPALGQLPHLRSLRLLGLGKVRCIGIAFYGVGDNYSSSRRRRPSSSAGDQLGLSRQSFPALQRLELDSLSDLVDWMGVETMTSAATGGQQAVFPKLEGLGIWNCPRLRSAPSHFTSLKRLSMWNAGCNTELMLLSICDKVNTLIDLEICDCPNLKSIFSTSGHQLPSSLENLVIIRCNEFRSLSDELALSPCTSLRWLAVSDCPNLVSFPVDLRHHPSLSSLKLYRCPKLITVPKIFGTCTSLRSLSISPCPGSPELDWSELSSSSVRQLGLYGWPHSVSLPDQLQCLTAITGLSLTGFGSMESVPDWLENLVSLEVLRVSQCEKLRYLPLPVAMRHLPNFRELRITHCPLLEESCIPSSPEWSKISHISKIYINQNRIS